jgi:ketoreductase RED2
VIREYVRAQAPLHRTGLPDDIAAAVVGILRADYTTGQILTVDGGLSLA